MGRQSTKDELAHYSYQGWQLGLILRKLGKRKKAHASEWFRQRGEEAEVFIVQLSLVLGEGCFGDALIFQHSGLHMSVERSSMALEKALSPEMQIIGGGVIQAQRDGRIKGHEREFATNPASKMRTPYGVHSRALVKWF